jgi:hypothetical protein
LAVFTLNSSEQKSLPLYYSGEPAPHHHDVLRHAMFLSSYVPAHWAAMKPLLPHSQWLILALLDTPGSLDHWILLDQAEFQREFPATFVTNVQLTSELERRLNSTAAF